MLNPILSFQMTAGVKAKMADVSPEQTAKKAICTWPLPLLVAVESTEGISEIWFCEPFSALEVSQIGGKG